MRNVVPRSRFARDATSDRVSSGTPLSKARRTANALATDCTTFLSSAAKEAPPLCSDSEHLLLVNRSYRDLWALSTMLLDARVGRQVAVDRASNENPDGRRSEGHPNNVDVL